MYFPFGPAPSGWCTSVLGAAVASAGGVNAMNLAAGVTNYGVGLGLGLLLILERRRWRGAIGTSLTSDALLLPVYHFILLVLAAEALIVATVDVFVDMGSDRWAATALQRSMAPSLLYGVGFAMFHFVVDGVAILLVQPSFGCRALAKAALTSSIWATVCWAGFVLAYQANAIRAFMLLQDLILDVFYCTIVFAPARMIFRRPAVRLYARFLFALHCVYTLGGVMYFSGVYSGLCLNEASELLQDALSPFILLLTLRRDSAYWQDGIAAISEYAPVSAVDASGPRRSTSLSVDTAEGSASPLARKSAAAALERNRLASVRATIVAPLLDTFLPRATAAELAVRLDENRTIPLLNHATISLSLNKVLGAGGTARVYQGRWKGKRVAIKMIYCMTITPDQIQQIVAEGAALGGIKDPNVVEVYGIAVAPPSVCLVMELCVRSLRALLSDSAEYAALTLRDKVDLCIGACKGVACLHAQRPPIRHNDLKALNFLIDARGNVKVADLGLSVTGSAAVDTLTAVIGDAEHRTCNWLAPEVTSASSPAAALGTTASDIYSLGVTFWEVFTGDTPFADITYNDLCALAATASNTAFDPASVSEHSPRATLVRVAVGTLHARPPLPVFMHPRVRALLEGMWALDPAQRPSALQVLQQLERLAAEV